MFGQGAQDAQDAVEGPDAQSLIGAAKLASGLWAWALGRSKTSFVVPKKNVQLKCAGRWRPRPRELNMHNSSSSIKIYGAMDFLE